MNKRKNKNIYEKILYTILLIFLTRLLTNVPIIGVNKKILGEAFKNSEIFNLFNMFSGGGLSNLSMFALSISPYISASIIMQLLGTMIPRLEEIQQEGETGRKRIERYTNAITIIIGLFSAIALTNQFINIGAIPDTLFYTITTIVSLILGTVVLIVIGKKITDNGIGNGISLILTMNILSQIPKDFMLIYNKYVVDNNNEVVAKIVMFLVIFTIIYLTIKIHETNRNVPLVYSGKLKGKKFIDGNSACLPIKLSPGGVTPVIFTTTLMAIPSMISSVLNVKADSFMYKVTEMFKSENWFKTNSPKMTWGYVIYSLLLIMFAYIYSDIALNTKEIANTLKTQNATIPNIRQGAETEGFLNDIIKGTTLLGALSLIFLCTIPILLTTLLGVRVGFGGTSIIIVVSVLTEIVNQIKIELEARRNNSFTF